MKTNDPQGRAYCIIITAYLLIKAVLNMILGGALNFGDLIAAIVFGAAMFTGLQFVNYAAAGYLVIIAAVHFPANITHLSSNWIYLLEGLIDIACAALLCTVTPIKNHFTNKWSEFSQLFKN